MKLFSLLIIIFMTGCGGTFWVEECPGEWAFNAGGIFICSEGKLDANEIEYAVQVVEGETSLVYPEVVSLEKTLKDNEVAAYFIDENLALNCELIEHDVYRCEDYLNGVNYGGNHLYVRYHSCLAMTSLGHELLHSIEAYYLNRFDETGHLTPGLFWQSVPGDPGNAVENKIFRELFYNLASCEELRNRVSSQ